MTIEAVGDWRDKNVVISEKGGRELATITRKYNLKNIVLEDYYIRINSGVDKAMIVLLALAFDELDLS